MSIPACERDNLLTRQICGCGERKYGTVELSYGTLLRLHASSGGHISHETDIDVSVDVANWTAAVAQLTKAASAHAHIKVEVVTDCRVPCRQADGSRWRPQRVE